MNSAYLLVGSNIDPVQNTQKALDRLRAKIEVVEMSRAWETPSFGSPGPNFINLAVHVLTGLDRRMLKEQVIGYIEQGLGRVRTPDKNAPRTIDIDILIFNGEIIDNSIWDRPHVLLPLGDLLPDLKQPVTDRWLREICQELLAENQAVLRDDLIFAKD